MYAKHYASVIEGLNVFLDLQDKNKVNLDYSLISNLTYSIIHLNTVKKEDEDEEETKKSTASIDEDAFKIFDEELQGIEDHLDEDEEEEKEVKTSENDRQFLISQLTKLFDRIQKLFPRDVNLYDLLYIFYSETNQVDNSFDALLKKTRSCMTGNYLASEETVKRVLTSSYNTLKFCKDHELTKKFFEVKMLCRSIVSRCQRQYSGLEEFIQLKTIIDESEK